MFLHFVWVVCHGTRNKGLIVEFWCFLSLTYHTKHRCWDPGKLLLKCVNIPLESKGGPEASSSLGTGRSCTSSATGWRWTKSAASPKAEACSSFLALTPSTTPGSPPICPPALKSRSLSPHHPCTSDKMILSDVFAWYSLMLCHSIEGSKPGCHVNLYNSSDGYSCYQLQFFGNYDFHSLSQLPYDIGRVVFESLFLLYHSTLCTSGKSSFIFLHPTFDIKKGGASF